MWRERDLTTAAPRSVASRVAWASRGRIGSEAMGQRGVHYPPKTFVVKEKCRRVKRRLCWSVCLMVRETGG